MAGFKAAYPCNYVFKAIILDMTKELIVLMYFVEPSVYLIVNIF